MKNHLNKLIQELKNKPYVNAETVNRFTNRVKAGNGLIKEENEKSHFCSFFLPVDVKLKQVFLGHHKKAGGWIPPGGHIEKNETPLDSVYREFIEELKHELTNEKVKLFDLSVIDIVNSKSVCRVHWDIWYLVYMNITELFFDKREFYDAGWLTIPQALQRMKKFEIYRRIINKLPKLNF